MPPSAGEITFINDHAARLLGTTVEQAMGGRLEDVLLLQDQDGQTWLHVNRPDRSISTRTGIPEQSWLNSSGEEVLTTARHGARAAARARWWAWPSGSATVAGGPGSTASAPTSSRPSPTSCAPR